MTVRRLTQSTDTALVVRAQQVLSIDRDDLDGALIEQPNRLYEVALSYAQAVAARDAAKMDLEHVQAQLDIELRQQFEERGERYSETRLTAEVHCHSRYLEAKQAHWAAATEVGYLGALKEATFERSAVLKELVALEIGERGARAGASGSYEARARRIQEAEQSRSAVLRERRFGNPR